MENNELLAIITAITDIQRQTISDDAIQLMMETRAKPDPYSSEDTKELDTAMSKAWGEFPKIGYNRDNPFFKSNYADLQIIIDTIRPLLAKNGLYISYFTEITAEGMTILRTRLRHASGQWIETRARIIPQKNDQQSYGSCLTYNRRYSILSLLGLGVADDPHDDDAEREMVPVRDVKSKGVAINTKYNPQEEKYEPITREQREELEYELTEYPDIVELVLEGLKIQSIADMPKSKFMVSITRIRDIKNARNGLK